jgi:diguanylate cyclase (GGDEF)-like protein/PAS domain S-box-containing protein
MVDILLLEDSPIDAELIGARLDLAGIAHRARRVVSRAEFLAALRERRWDLILADQKLPSFDGMAALAIARAEMPEVPFIFVSGTLGEEVAVESLKLGATDYVLKQRLQRLPVAVRRALAEAEERAARRRAEEHERLLEADYRALFEQAAFGIERLAAEGRLLEANSRLCALLGFAREELVGRSFRDVTHPEDVAAEAASLGPLFAGEIASHTLEKRYLRRDGTPVWVRLTASLARSGADAYRVAVVEDITERREAEERFRHLVLHDPLTGLPNRALLQDRLDHAVEMARREGHRVGVLLLDLDNFKAVNDTLGHPSGDRLLRLVATRLAGTVRGSDTLARLGGDEFALVQDRVDGPADCARPAERMVEALRRPFELDGQEIHSGVSIGVALTPEDGESAAELLKSADLALYRAKAEGRGRHCLFEPAMAAAALERRRSERELRQALDRGDLILHYQPQIELATGRLVAAEALVQWPHPERGLIPPDELLPLAEASGLVRRLVEWVLREVCRHARVWQERRRAIRAAVNLPPAELLRPDIVALVEAVLKEARLAPDRLELGVPEALLAERHEDERPVHALARSGVCVAVERFGTGHSPLAALRELPVATVKIDSSLLPKAAGGPRDEALLGGIVALAHGLGARAVAGGIERPDQLAVLRRVGCDAGQGYLLGRPRPAEAIELLEAQAA